MGSALNPAQNINACSGRCDWLDTGRLQPTRLQITLMKSGMDYQLIHATIQIQGVLDKSIVLKSKFYVIRKSSLYSY